jgi:hypothetical protein
MVLKPAYWLCERFAHTASATRRLGLVTLDEMVGAIAWAVDNPPHDVQIIDVEDIRRISQAAPVNTIRSASTVT